MMVSLVSQEEVDLLARLYGDRDRYRDVWAYAPEPVGGRDPWELVIRGDVCTGPDGEGVAWEPFEETLVNAVVSTAHNWLHSYPGRSPYPMERIYGAPFVERVFDASRAAVLEGRSLWPEGVPT